MGSCATEDKACGNQPTNTRMIYRRPISLVVPDPQSLTEKTKETDRKLQNNRHLLTGQSIPEDIKAMARYVIANPVRAGLSYSVGSYPHWDAAWL